MASEAGALTFTPWLSCWLVYNLSHSLTPLSSDKAVVINRIDGAMENKTKVVISLYSFKVCFWEGNPLLELLILMLKYPPVRSWGMTGSSKVGHLAK